MKMTIEYDPRTREYVLGNEVRMSKEEFDTIPNLEYETDSEKMQRISLNNLHRN